MIETIIRTIPRGINEILFLIGIAGFIHFYKHKKKDNTCKLFLIITAFMFTWRVLVRIQSSRYCAILIVFFIFAASYFLYTILKETKRGLIYFSVLFVLLFFYQVIKVFHIDHDGSYAIIDLIKRKENVFSDFFLVYYKDYYRCAVQNKHIILHDMSPKELIEHLEDIKKPYDYYASSIIRKNDSFLEKKEFQDKTKIVLSSKDNKKSKNRHIVFQINSNSFYKPVSKSQVSFSSDGNLITNGDFELIDSQEDSFNKLKAYNKSYNLYFDKTSLNKTAANTYFYTGSDLSSMPTFTVSDENPIHGNKSVYIHFSDGLCCLYFSQKFKSGSYSCSFFVQGKTGTEIGLFRNTYIDSKGCVIPLVIYTLPNRLLHKITVNFSTEHFSPNDYFLLGVWVKNGTAKLDCFELLNSDLPNINQFK